MIRPTSPRDSMADCLHSPPTSPRPGFLMCPIPSFPSSSVPSSPLCSRESVSSKDCDPLSRDLPYLDFHPVTEERVRRLILGEHSSTIRPSGENTTAAEKAQAAGLVTFSRFNQIPIGIKPSVSPSIDRVVTPGEKYLSLLYIHLAYSCYAALGSEVVMTPKSSLFLDPHRDEVISTAQSVASSASVHAYGIESLKMVFYPIEGYQNFLSAQTKDKNGRVFTFIDYIRTTHRLPETLISPEGTSVPLRGAVGLLAIARILADIAPIGQEGKNAGFVWVTDTDGKIIAAQTVHAAQTGLTARTATSCSNRFFHFRVSTNRAYGLCCKDERMPARTHYLKNPGIKDLQICEDDSLKISWNQLSRKQKEEFVQVLIHVSRFFKSPEILSFLFERGGVLYPPEMSESLKDQVAQLKGRVASWLDVQLKIYHEELSALEAKYLTSIKMVRKIDKIGDLDPKQIEKVIKIIYQSICRKNQLLERDREAAELKTALEEAQFFLDGEAKNLQEVRDELRAEKEAHQALQEAWIKLEEQKDLTAKIQEINGGLVRKESSPKSVFRRSLRVKSTQDLLKGE